MDQRAPLSKGAWRGKLVLAPLLVLSLLVALPAWAGTLWADVLDVGQGDAIFIRSPEGKTVLIDAGPGKTDVVAALRARGVSGLDLVVATHPHRDHIGGMEHVVNQLPISAYMDSGQSHNTATYEALMEAVAELGIPYVRAEKGQRIQLGSEAVLYVLWPGKIHLSGTRSNHNSNSVVLRLEHQGHCMLFTGDAEAETERRLLAQHPTPCEVLKVAHHGGAHSTTGRFLEAFQPQIALISVGANGWGHPTEETLGRLARRGIQVYRTDQDGTIRVLSSEAGIEVREAMADGRRSAWCCRPEPSATTHALTSLVPPAPEDREEPRGDTLATETDVLPTTRQEKREARREARRRRRERRRERRGTSPAARDAGGG